VGIIAPGTFQVLIFNQSEQLLTTYFYSSSEILKMFLLTVGKGNAKYSTEQAWHLIKSLAKNDTLRYNEVLLSNTFASSLTPSASNAEAALESLSAAELISIKTYKGRPQTIKAGKPVYQAAFKLLTEDRVLKSRLDLAVLTELTKIETKSIDKYETELNMLGSLPRQPREVAPRVQFLLGKLAVSQAKIQAWEKEMATLKTVLLHEY
jgi:RNA12 protein